MKATEQLKAEHEGIALMLQVLEQICSNLEAGDPVDTSHLDKITEFLRVFVDQCHHGKEEDLLFPALEESGIPKEHGPIAQMLLEHDYGRNSIREIARSLERYKGGDRQAGLEIASHARNYINMLRLHIEKENSVLFVMADQKLSDEKQDALFNEFENLEQTRIGLGKHEEFHALLQNLVEIYLK